MAAALKPTIPTGPPPLPKEFTLETFIAWQKRYRFDMNLFVREMWNVEPDIWQEEAGDKLSKDEQRRMCIPSGHGVGKTAWDSWAAIWFFLTRFPVKVILTAPSASTLQDGLMAEIKTWLVRLPPVLQEMLETTADRVTLTIAPERAFISARTARAEKPDALQGVHADYVMLIVDEASGVPEAVFESSQGSMSGPARFMILTGNPVYASGYFYEAMTTGSTSLWWVRHVSCLEAKRSPQEYVDEIATLYGTESNTYRVRVLGLPPTGDEDSIIPLGLIQSAFEREVQRSTTMPIVWGLDVARMGANQAALARRQGNYCDPTTVYRNCDLMQLVGQVAAEYHSLPDFRRPVEICIDSIGEGSGVADRLKELGLPAVRINVSEHKAISDAYWNMKAELWWRAKAWFAALDCRMVRDDNLVKALSCVKIHHHSSGKLMVEPKDKIEQRLRTKAPRLDAADAFVLTFASQATASLYGRQKQMGKRGALRRRLPGIV